jgi:hypothetical protein
MVMFDMHRRARQNDAGRSAMTLRMLRNTRAQF